MCIHEVHISHMSHAHPQSETQLLRDRRQVLPSYDTCGLTMILYDVPSGIARNIYIGHDFSYLKGSSVIHEGPIHHEEMGTSGT